MLAYTAGDTDVPLLEETIGDNFERIVARFPYQDALIEAAAVPGEEARRWSYTKLNDDVDRVAREGFTTEFCLQEAAKVRNQTRDLLFTYNDKDLERTIHYERHDKPTEHNLRWILHHLVDHEAQHKGQILMLKRLMAL